MICEDDFKGYTHATAACLFAVMTAYNLMRWCATRHRRNAVNLALYGPLVLWEMRQARLHWSQPRAVNLIDNARLA